MPKCKGEYKVLFSQLLNFSIFVQKYNITYNTSKQINKNTHSQNYTNVFLNTYFFIQMYFCNIALLN